MTRPGVRAMCKQSLNSVGVRSRGRASTRDLDPVGVDLERTDPPAPRARAPERLTRAEAARPSIAGQQLAGAHRLHEVVVGAHPEGEQLVDLFGARGEDHDRHVRGGADDGAGPRVRRATAARGRAAPGRAGPPGRAPARAARRRPAPCGSPGGGGRARSSGPGSPRPRRPGRAAPTARLALGWHAISTFRGAARRTPPRMHRTFASCVGPRGTRVAGGRAALRAAGAGAVYRDRRPHPRRTP
jgi:hypothetical protein